MPLCELDAARSLECVRLEDVRRVVLRKKSEWDSQDFLDGLRFSMEGYDVDIRVKTQPVRCVGKNYGLKQAGALKIC